MKNVAEYKFQFNHDTDSCLALASLIADRWEITGFKIEDGYTWFLMFKQVIYSKQVEGA